MVCTLWFSCNCPNYCAWLLWLTCKYICLCPIGPRWIGDIIAFKIWEWADSVTDRTDREILMIHLNGTIIFIQWLLLIHLNQMNNTILVETQKEQLYNNTRNWPLLSKWSSKGNASTDATPKSEKGSNHGINVPASQTQKLPPIMSPKPAHRGRKDKQCRPVIRM